MMKSVTDHGLLFLELLTQQKMLKNIDQQETDV